MTDNQRQYFQAYMQMKNLYSAAFNTPLMLPYILNCSPENLMPQLQYRSNPHSQAFLPYNQGLLGSRPVQSDLWQMIYSRMAAAEAQNPLKANLAQENPNKLSKKSVPDVQLQQETHSVSSDSKELEASHEQMITYAEVQEPQSVKIENDSETSCDNSKAGVEKVSASKKIRKNTCGHPNRDYFAKGLCNSCYHKKNRARKPTLCSHEHLYARDLCQSCYTKKYRKVKLFNSCYVKANDNSLEQATSL